MKKDIFLPGMSDDGRGRALIAWESTARVITSEIKPCACSWYYIGGPRLNCVSVEEGTQN